MRVLQPVPPAQVAETLQYTVVVPAYNEAATIVGVIEAFLAVAPAGTTIIVVDDGSADGTAELARAAGAHIVRHARNRGLGASFRRGIEEALSFGADVIVTADGDGQFDAFDFPRLVAPIEQGDADVVTGSRFHPQTPNPSIRGWKRLGNRLFTRLTNRISGERFSDTQCGYRAYSRDAALRLTTFGRYTYTQEALLDMVEKGMRVKEIPIHIRPRHGHSRLVRSVWHYGFQTLPLLLRKSRDHAALRFFTAVGGSLGLVGALALGFVFLHWVRTGFTSPFHNVVLLGMGLALLGGITVVLGFLADMLERNRRMQDEILYRLRVQTFGGPRQ